MPAPNAYVRHIDRARALRAVLAFRGNDALAVAQVAREAAGDSNPESVAHLVLALTELAASFLNDEPEADDILRQGLLTHAQLEAEGRDPESYVANRSPRNDI